VAKHDVKVAGHGTSRTRARGAGLSDHDLLIRIDERLDGVEMALKNHLHHHWWITVAALTAATGAILTALMRAL